MPYLDTITIVEEIAAATKNETYNSEGYALKIAPNPYRQNSGLVMYSLKSSALVSFHIYTTQGTNVGSMEIEVSDDALTDSFTWEKLRSISAGTYIIKMNVNGVEKAAFNFTKLQ